MRSCCERGFKMLQGIFFNMYFVTYLLAPKYCHSFVGYLEVSIHVHAPCHGPSMDLAAVL